MLQYFIERVNARGRRATGGGQRARAAERPAESDRGAERVRTPANAERVAVIEAIEAAKGNISQAAGMSGITRKRLYRIGRVYGLKSWFPYTITKRMNGRRAEGLERLHPPERDALFASKAALRREFGDEFLWLRLFGSRARRRMIPP